MGLLSFLFGSGNPQQQTSGGGLLQSGNDQQVYQDYAERAMTSGQKPVPPAQWRSIYDAYAAMQQKQGQQPLSYSDWSSKQPVMQAPPQQ